MATVSERVPGRPAVPGPQHSPLGPKTSRGGAEIRLEPSAYLYLDEKTSLLRRGRIGPVRYTPLIGETTITDLLLRRRALFSSCLVEETRYGHQVTFTRHVKASRQHPDGRSVSGQFDVLRLQPNICLLVSVLPADPHDHGPGLLAERAYPLATKPFLHSSGLTHLIYRMAAQYGWTPTALDSMGYDQKTLAFRRDQKKQPVEDVLREMREQKRHLHKIRVRLEDRDGRQAMVASFSRHGEAVVYYGAPRAAVEGFVLPTAGRVTETATQYSVECAPTTEEQMVLQIEFPDSIFKGREEMEDLCRATRTADGLSVTTVHLNPYLQAQVLDFFSGATLEMLVLDDHTVSLIPRSRGCRGAIERVAETIFYYFGEAQVRRQPVRV